MNERRVSLRPLDFEEAVKALAKSGPPKRGDSQAEASYRTTGDASRPPETLTEQTAQHPKSSDSST